MSPKILREYQRETSVECNCRRDVIPGDTHDLSCPASLYRAGRERGRAEARATVVAFLRARIEVLDDYLGKGGTEYDRTVHTAQILALHEAARLIELGERTWP